MAGTRFHSDNRFMHGSNCTWARSGETEFAISRVTTSLYFEFEPKENQKEVFPRNFEYSLSRCFSLFYLQAASQTHAFDAGDTMWRPSSSWVDHKQTARSLRLFVLRRKATRTQAQLHTLGVEVPSKQIDTKIKLHAMSVVEVDLNLAAAVFPNRTSFFPIPASGARSSADRSCATGDMATGPPRAWKYRDPCREAYGHFAQCFRRHLEV